MKGDEYEKIISELLLDAKPVNHSLTPCQEGFVPQNLPKVRSIIYKGDCSCTQYKRRVQDQSPNFKILVS